MASKDTGRITLFRNSTGWNAQFSGEVAEPILFAFGTDILPVSYMASAPANQVQREIQAKWPRCIVGVREE